MAIDTKLPLRKRSLIITVNTETASNTELIVNEDVIICGLYNCGNSTATIDAETKSKAPF